jgi:signal transduction histidine kinase/ligand-binding sensor domain-containing protein/DNA-binding response OmpR family regulator
MMAAFRICLALLLSWGTPTWAWSYDIKKIGVENGLSNNNVVSIAQDRDGFIWICTKDGLNRYDAHSFTVFKKSEDGTNSLSSNVLNCVHADKFDDIVWIATEKNGIDAYHYRTHRFVHYEHDNSGANPNSLIANGVTHITSDEKGNLWLATYQSGLDYFDKQTGLFTHYNQSNVKGLGSDYNWYVMYESPEVIYVGHVNEGFSIVNIKNRTAQNYVHIEGDPASLPDNTVTCIFKDSKRNVWIGTRNGLALFNPQTGKMVNFGHDANNPRSLSHNFIKSFVEAPDGRLWIGTEGGGVSILDLKGLGISPNPQSVTFERIGVSNTPHGLSSASVQSILLDGFGNFWMGGYIGGLNIVKSKPNFFSKLVYLPLVDNPNSLNSKIVTSMCVDAGQRVWMANGIGGICTYDKGTKTGQFTRFGNGQTQVNVTSVYRDGEDNIWAGTIDGRVFRYSGNGRGFNEVGGFDEIKNLQIYSFFEDSRKTLWMTTDIGLLAYNRQSGHHRLFTTANSELSDNVIRAIAEDADGNLWVGTLIGGLCVFDADFKLLFNYGRYYDFYSVTHIYRDSQNRMWVASQNDLFLFRNHANESVVRIGKSWGLAESNIRAVVEGQSANDIWISTTSGISHMDLATKQIKNFNISDNLVMGDYLYGSMAKTRDGHIYFGSQNGVTYFNQVYTGQEVATPQTHITGFWVNNSKNENLNRLVDIPFASSMELPYNQNSFQINYSVMDVSLADKVEFMFQMAGLDENWYLVNDEKQVTFRNLKPGDYSFSIKARTHNGNWQSEPTRMSITIHPPLWLTWYAKMFYLVALLAIVYLILRFAKNKLAIENALAMEKKGRQQEHLLNEEKLKFFTNITHELRTPMTLILGPLEDLVADQTLTAAHSKKINNIHRVANRLLQLINQILEFRKSETQNRKLSVVQDDLVQHVGEIGQKYTELANQKQVGFNMLLPNSPLHMFFDPEVITIVLDNLLSNAFKFTPKGNVTLELKNTSDGGVATTELLVSDTGFGISDSDLPHVFERYYQAPNTPYPITGTGIGLALVKSLVELHEGEIVVSSQVGKGTVFSIRLLTRNAYPNAVHQRWHHASLNEEEVHETAKKVILVVDDNVEIVDYIRECLGDDYQILTAENGQKGLEGACDKVPDVVISDIMMPVMDGIELCKAMKRDVRTCHIPVILLTAKGSMQDKSEGYDAGADSYLTKPFSGNLLKSRLRNILDSRKMLAASFGGDFKGKQMMFSDSTNKLDKEFLEKLNAVIENNIEDEEMNIAVIATHLNMSHSTLYRKIKALTNLTANEYIRKVRMRVAEQLLLTNKYSISEIMYRVGINSNGYFRQCFKEEFGWLPSEYLQKIKDGQGAS